jgi:5-methylcytosine-specific restriction enzyme A
MARYRKRQALERGPNGRCLCRWCGTETTPPRRTFCSDACVSEYLIRSNGGDLRRAVFGRDRGVCALCGFDAEAFKRSLKGLGYARKAARLRELGIPTHRISFWDADHIVPVVEGGGEAGLDNLRTLCIPCHKSVTAELMTRLREPKDGESPEADPTAAHG